jgi:tRNA(Ile)-lysidine synthase
MNSITSIIESFLKTVPIKPGDKILAAVSGGADSVAMLHLLSQSTILCAHINHHLRDKESDQDQAFLETLCADWHIPLFVEQIDVKAYAATEKLSIETAARHLRLEALERIAQKTGCSYIATAHHKDDQAETVLFRLLRGTAFAGLSGIHPTREHNGLLWIRPMLNLRRSQIEAYCNQNNITWCNDASNIETHYRRNWIRHRLLPHLQQQSTADLTEKLAALAQSALTLQQQVETSAAQILSHSTRVAATELTCGTAATRLSLPKSLGCEANTAVPSNNKTGKTGDSYLFSQNLPAKSIQQTGPFVAGEILRTVLTHLNCGLRDLTLSHYQNFFQLLKKTSGTLQLPADCTIQKKKDVLIFKTSSCRDSQSTIYNLQSTILLPIPDTIQFSDWRIQARLIQIAPKDLQVFQNQKDNSKQWFDLKKIKSPLIVRNRCDDDSFTPFGRKTKKRISRFLSDSQIPENQRESCIIIADQTGILWLAPIRRSALAPITPDTIDVLEIRINNA